MVGKPLGVYRPLPRNQTDIRSLLCTSSTKCVSETIPFAFDYLEGQLDGEYLVGRVFSVADISVGSVLRQYQLAGETVDASRWPKLAAYSEAILARGSFRSAAQAENQMMGGWSPS